MFFNRTGFPKLFMFEAKLKSYLHYYVMGNT